MENKHVFANWIPKYKIHQFHIKANINCSSRIASPHIASPEGNLSDPARNARFRTPARPTTAAQVIVTCENIHTSTYCSIPYVTQTVKFEMSFDLFDRATLQFVDDNWGLVTVMLQTLPSHCILLHSGGFLHKIVYIVHSIVSDCHAKVVGFKPFTGHGLYFIFNKRCASSFSEVEKWLSNRN